MPTTAGPVDHRLTGRVHAANGDTWQAQGRLREGLGGGAAELSGIRLMASGLAHPQWNSGDVVDPAVVDIESVRAWYAARDVPWGVRVPVGLRWPYGRKVVAKRNMGVLAADLRLTAPPPQVEVRTLRADDLDPFVSIDAEAFDDDNPHALRAWTAPMVGADGFLPVLAHLAGEPVGVACGVLTDDAGGAGGTSIGVFGVGVRPAARRQGIGAALTTYLLRWGLASGADLGWLNPDTEEAARLYASLGFEETGGFDVYVDN